MSLKVRLIPDIRDLTKKLGNLTVGAGTGRVAPVDDKKADK